MEQQQSTTIAFPGGDSLLQPTISSLKESAGSWAAMGRVHAADAEIAMGEGKMALAMLQFRYAETKLATARVYLAEALELEAMEYGS